MGPVARRTLAGAVPLGLTALAALAVLCTGLAYLRGPSAFNSDNLLCSALCADALRVADLSGWNFPGAPYLFPDALLLLPCHALCPGLPAAYLAYDALFYGSALACLFWLARQLGTSRGTALAAAAAGLALALSAHLREAYRGVGQLLGHPGNHVGAVLLGLLLTALTARALRRGGHGPWGAAAFVLCGGLGAFSDKLLLVQFVLPGCLALAALALCRRVCLRQLLGHAAVVGAALLLAEGLQRLLVRLGVQFEGFAHDFHRPRLAQLGTLLGQLGHLLEGQHLLLALTALNFLAALLVLWAWRKAAGAGAAAPFVALTVLLVPVCNVLALFLTGMSGNPAVPRYLLAVYLLPFLFPCLLLALLPWRAARLGRALLLAFAAALTLHQCVPLLPQVGREALRPPYPPLARALDRLVEEHGPLRGLAGYWAARELTFLTRSHTPVLPLDAGGSPCPHGSNACGFLDPRPGALGLPEYRLLVVTPGRALAPHPDVLRAQFGEPLKTVQVGADQLWLYERLDGPLLDRYLRSLLARRVRRALPHVAPEAPAALAGPKRDGTPPTAGGVVRLGPGQSLEVRFPRPVAAALLDVAADRPDRLRLLFYRGDEPVGALSVPPLLWAWSVHFPPGLQSRLLTVPPELRGRPWDRVVVRAPADAGASVGHLLAFEQEPPGLAARPAGAAPSFPEHQRFTAPALSSAAPPASLVADPAATAGRAWRAPDGFAGYLACGPLLALRPGRYHVDFTLKVDDNSSEAPVARLVGGGRLMPGWGGDPTRPCVRELRGTDFPAPGRYATYRLTFDAPEGVDLVPFWVEALGPARVTLDRIDLTRCPAPPD
jgi:hypothetical protein